MNTHPIKATLSIVISLIMAFTIMPAGAFATQQPDNHPVSISEEDVTSEDAIEEESTEDSTTFDLGDGRNMTVFYNGDVRYENEQGKLVDIDPSLVQVYSSKSISDKSLSGYAYETAASDSKAYLPEELSDDTPLLLEKDKYSISFAPAQELSFAEPKVTKEEFLNGYEEKEMAQTLATYETEDVSLQYESQIDGIKEKIIFPERPDEDYFDFNMTMEGLTPVLDEEGGITAIDQETEEAEGFIESPFMIDDDDNYSEDISYEIIDLKETKTGSSFTLRFSMDPDYLDDASYPLTVDPSYTWNGNDELRDVYIKNGSYASNNYYGSSYMTIKVGKDSSGARYRDMIQLNNLRTKLKGKYVDSAVMTLYQKDGNESGQLVKAYRNLASWRSTTVTWNNQPDNHTVAAGSLNTTGTNKAARALDITPYARNVANGSVSNYGLKLKNMTSTTGYAAFYGSRTTATSYRPKLTVIYYDGPTRPTKITFGTEQISSGYVTSGNTLRANYEGITSHNLKYVQYKILRVDADGSLTSVIPYGHGPWRWKRQILPRAGQSR